MTLLPLVHIITGTAAVVMGAVTLAAPKGRKVHIMAGRAFIFMMLASSAFGAALGLLKWETLFITFRPASWRYISSQRLAGSHRTRARTPAFHRGGRIAESRKRCRAARGRRPRDEQRRRATVWLDI